MTVFDIKKEINGLNCLQLKDKIKGEDLKSIHQFIETRLKNVELSQDDQEEIIFLKQWVSISFCSYKLIRL